MKNKLELIIFVTFITMCVLSWVMYFSRGAMSDIVLAAVSSIVLLFIAIYRGDK